MRPSGGEVLLFIRQSFKACPLQLQCLMNSRTSPNEGRTYSAHGRPCSSNGCARSTFKQLSLQLKHWHTVVCALGVGTPSGCHAVGCTFPLTCKTAIGTQLMPMLPLAQVIYSTSLQLLLQKLISSCNIGKSDISHLSCSQLPQASRSVTLEHPCSSSPENVILEWRCLLLR